MNVTQGVAANVVVLLSKDNAAVTGLTFGDVVVQICKEGGAFAAKAVDATTFTELGLGAYAVQLSAADLDTLGTLTLVVTGATIDQSTTLVSVVAADQASTVASLQTCIVSGHVFDAQGNPVTGAAVSAKVMGRPSIEQSAAAVTGSLISAKTDSNGQFFLSLVRLADVEVYIPQANYRRRLVVPNQASARLFDIP